jgi:hypothetical protein
MIENNGDNINKVESDILAIYNTKVNIFNCFGIVNKIKKLVAKFWIFFSETYRHTERISQTQLDILNIIIKIQKQIDNINYHIKKMEGDNNGKDSDNYGR